MTLKKLVVHRFLDDTITHYFRGVDAQIRTNTDDSGTFLIEVIDRESGSSIAGWNRVTDYAVEEVAAP